MRKTRIRTPKVPERPPKTYSQALRKGSFLSIAGQVPKNARGQTVGKGDPYRQSRQVFQNIQALVEAAGGTMDDILKMTVYVTDIRHADAVRKARREFFQGDFPTSTFLCVTALASPDYLVEIETDAVLDN